MIKEPTKQQKKELILKMDDIKIDRLAFYDFTLSLKDIK